MESARLVIDVETISGRRTTIPTNPNVNCQQIEFEVVKSFDGDDVDGGQKGFMRIVDESGRTVPNDPEQSISEYFNMSLKNSKKQPDRENVKLFVRHYRYHSYCDYILSHQPLWKRLVIKFIMAIVGSFFLAAMSQISFYWPWNPTVPVTFQTLAVFLNGALLGFIFGPLSVLLYLMYGAIGAPFFAGQTGGVKILQGPTSGYLLGFILAAFFVGFFSQLGWDRRWRTTILSMIIGNIIIYIFGVPVLAWHLRATTGFGRVLVIGLVNFLAGDAVKIAIATLLVPLGWKALALVFNRKQKAN